MVFVENESDLWRMREILEMGWSQETTYDKEGYMEKSCKSWGQCYVTARALNRVFGWGILRAHIDEVNVDHYWNAMPNRREIDFTSDQFGGDGVNKLDYLKGRLILKEYKSINPRLKKYLDIVEMPLRRLREELEK